MAVKSAYDRRRCVPVSLRDIPLERRLAAARRLIPEEHDQSEKLALLQAALNPSDTTYWIAA